jgi:integrase
VPVIPALKAVLEAYRVEPLEREPHGDYDPGAMFKVNLYDMGRATIKPLVAAWKGWHALHRGLASNLFELGADDLTVMIVLRHASVTVTRQHYIKVRAPKMTAAMASLESAVTRSVQGAAGTKPSVPTK